MIRRTLMLSLLAACSAAAQGLPDKPKAQPAGKEFWVETAAVAASWAADTISTHQTLAAHPSAVEAGWLFTGSRSTPKIMASWAAVDVGVVVVAYEWKRHVHNKYLHPLWRVALAQRVAAHTSDAIGNWSGK